MTVLLKRFSVAALTALTLACGDLRPVLKVGADQASFQRTADPSTPTYLVAVVPFTIWNRGNATAFVPSCGARVLPVVEQMVNGRWESYSSGGCILTTANALLEIKAGASHRDEVAIPAAGHFRIRLPYSPDAQLRNPYDALSAEFDVH